MLSCYMTACQPLTARTEQICTQCGISQFLNSLGNISTEGQKIIILDPPWELSTRVNS